MIIKRKKFALLIVYTAILFYIVTLLISLWKNPTNTGVHSSMDKRNNINVFSQENDVFVFWHIQRTGGTYFNTQLVKLDIKPGCQCSTNPPVEGACRCMNTRDEQWLYSRFTTSSSCGVHPPLHDLALCAPAFLSAAEEYEKDTRKRYLFITVLREPIKRYLSEWRHLQIVPPWPSECADVKNPVETCLKATNKRSLSLRDFLHCPGNPANNRIAHMLTKDVASQCADLDYEETLLSAKKALDSLAFIGLTDDEKNTKNLFEATFGVKFLDSFHQSENATAESVLNNDVNSELLAMLHKKNSLDLEIYAYAKSLFYNRLNKYL